MVCGVWGSARYDFGHARQINIVRAITTFAVIGACILLAGCANERSIFRTRSFNFTNTARVVTEDARERNVILTPVVEAQYDSSGKKISTTELWRSCAEPPPDVFTAQNLSVAADLGITPEPNATQKLQAALASAETAGTLERTQTINLLRESMYRTCERYLSGAIGTPELVVQAARDQRAMVAILAIEQLTRTVRPASTILVPGGTSATVQNASDALAKWQAAKDNKDAAEKARQEAIAAQNALVGLKEKDGTGSHTCKEYATLAADKIDPANKDKCDAAQIKVDETTKAANQATNDYNDLVAVLPKLGLSTSQSSTSPAGTSSGGGGTVAAATDLSQVADAVKQIALYAFNFPEEKLFCITYLRTTSTTAGDKDLRESCTKYLVQSVAVETTENARTAAAQQGLREAVVQTDRIGAILACVAPANPVKKDVLTKLIAAANAKVPGSVNPGLANAPDAAGVRAAIQFNQPAVASLFAALPCPPD